MAVTFGEALAVASANQPAGGYTPSQLVEWASWAASGGADSAEHMANSMVAAQVAAGETPTTASTDFSSSAYDSGAVYDPGESYSYVPAPATSTTTTGGGTGGLTLDQLDQIFMEETGGHIGAGGAAFWPQYAAENNLSYDDVKELVAKSPEGLMYDATGKAEANRAAVEKAGDPTAFDKSYTGKSYAEDPYAYRLASQQYQEDLYGPYYTEATGGLSAIDVANKASGIPITPKTPITLVRTPGQISYPSTGIMGLPAITMPQFLPVGGLATRATKPYDAGSVLQGPTGLFRPVTTGAPPTAEEVTATEGMAEGGMAKATPADLGSKFDVESFKDKEGRLVGGYSRPIRDEFGVITGYDYRPYESDVVFGEELRSREAARQMTPEERARALLNMQVMSGRTGVSPTRGGLEGIEVRGPASRTAPRYYPFAEGGLASAAQNLARRGRGGDSMLVHMAPEEVSGLRALARAQGNDLTINPNTGLPEAFSLKKLFRAASFILPFIPIPGLFGMSSLLTRSILSGVAAGASAKGKFDFKQALGGGLRAYALGSLGEKMSGAATPGGTPTAPAPSVPEAAAVNPMAGATAPTITTPSGDVSLASSYTGAGGTPIGPQSLSADLTAPLKVGSGYTDVAAAPIYNAPIGPGGGPDIPVTGGSLPPGADTVPGRMSSVITPEGQGFGQPLTKGTEIAMAGLGGLSIEEGAKEARNYEIQAAAARREEEERQRRFDELFRRTLGRVPVRSGGQINLAKGGMTYMEAGGTTGPTGEPRVVQGTGDGMSDSVPATIEGVQEARLANDEFVIPADVVADIGNGSSNAGAKKLYGMMDRIRKARHGTTKQPPEINAESMMPA